MSTRLIYGPPGTGKSTTLVALFKSAAQEVGPENVGAITFTRAGADELRLRLARELKITGTIRDLKRKLPYVGTIHALCFKLLRCSPDQIVNGKKLQEFCADQHIQDSQDQSSYIPDELDSPYLDMPSYGARQIDVLRWAHAAARHRGIDFRAALALLPERLLSTSGMLPSHLLSLRDKYEAWKQARRLLDFEDLLELGAAHTLPVRYLFVDEVQDNSPLLFKVTDAWGYARTIRHFILAGDPYQAIYAFAGGNPDLFLRHEGTWHVLEKSHRLSQESARYAKRLLTQSGWDDPKLDQWDGAGGQSHDQSELYLARTNALLNEVFRAPMIEQGVPFAQLRGHAPLQTRSADAYVYLTLLRSGLAQPVPESLLDALPKGVVTPARRAQCLTGAALKAADLERIFHTSQTELRGLLPHARYFDRVLLKYGMSGLIDEPKILLSTVHGAKGREADRVTLVRSWGTLPAKEAAESPRGESLVAYVACTRHRVSLDLVDGGRGSPYPGF